MEKPVLVTYASKHGATAEIAERIGEAIRRTGLRAEVLDVSEVTELGRYTAVVIGSAVYIGRWRRQAVRFVTDHESELAGVPVWIFSSGPTGEEEADAFLDDSALPKALRTVAERIRPRQVVIFHGELDPEEMSPFENWIIKRVKAPLGDAREWDEIDAWGAGIAEALRTDAAWPRLVIRPRAGCSRHPWTRTDFPGR